MTIIVDKSKFFPLGIALGRNFCNRTTEQERLINNFKSMTASLVTSPRRYGKTSLVLNAIYRYKIPFAYIDLYAEMNELDLQKAILGGIGDVLYKLESVPKKALKFVTDFFAAMSISFSFKGTEIKVEFPRVQTTPAKIILSALKNLEDILQKRKKKVMIFLDEFQRVSEVSVSDTIEGALRHVAQQTNTISFVFSGSSRHLLSRIFNDRTKPFYKLCDTIRLDRIAEEHYVPFIQKKVQERWDKPISRDTIDAVFELTKRHPYYLNVLCHRLWHGEKVPTERQVFAAWEQYAQEEKSEVIAELELLSSNQAKMLRSIARYGATHQPTSKEFLALTKFSASSATQALKALLMTDYLYVDKEGKYHVLDPLTECLFM